MTKHFIGILVLCLSMILLTGCSNNDILAEKPDTTPPPPAVNDDVIIRDTETFGEYIDDGKQKGVLGLFISRTDKEIKMKSMGEIVTVVIPDGFPEKMMPEALVEGKAFIAYYNEVDDNKVLDYIEIIKSMR